MKSPNTEVIELCKKLFQAGFDRAALSFSTMLHLPIKAGNMQIIFSKPWEITKILRNSNDLTFLTTEVIGDIKGKSYLIFKKYDKDKIISHLLSKSKNFEQNEYFEDILLKELDNVLSAAVITEMSNTLDLKIYGDVPGIVRPAQKTKDWLSSEYEKSQKLTAIIASNNFEFESDHKLKPIFVWIMNERFFTALTSKAYENENSNIS